MKNMVAMAIIAASLLTSCTKSYNCTCTFVDSTGKTTEEVVGVMNTTKSKAKKACDKDSYPFKSTYTTVSCHIQ